MQRISPLLALLFLVASCEAPPSAPNLLLITMDTTRADHLSSYGYSRPTSPMLDALATEGVLFERAFSHVPITLPAHASILSGTFPLFHGARDNGHFVVRSELETLAERLKEQGYDTAAFVSAFVLDSRFGLNQGFDVYDDEYTQEWSEEKMRDARIYNQMVTDRPADQTTARALTWLQERGEKPFFLWVHYYDPHQRYDPPHPYDQVFQDSPYDGEIAFMDSQIGTLLETFRDRGLWRNTAVAVTADHGEGLGQHGETTHAVLTYDGTLHVPLIIKAPSHFPIEPSRTSRDVSHVDLFPTLLELLGLQPPQGLPGRSLVPLMNGEDRPQRPAYFESTLPHFSFGWEPLFGVRDQGWKYIHAPQRELYDLSQDPEELYNLAGSQESRRQEMEDLLFRVVEASVPPEGSQESTPLDAEAQRKLAALGYVGGGGGSDPGALNPREPSGRRSPNDGITFLPDYYLANGLAGRGRLAEAAEIFRGTLLPLDPANPSFLSTLANLERRLGHGEAAFELYRRAQALDPEDPTILIELGQLEGDRGRPEAAEALFETVQQLAPDNLTASYLRAYSAAANGRPKDAIEQYRKVLELDPSHRDSQINLGIELAKTGDSEAARKHFQQALVIAPFSPRAHYNLALLLLGKGLPREASTSFQNALRYRRPYPAARLGLATALLRSEDPESARQELEKLIEQAPRSPLAVQAKEMLGEIGIP
ncbi:MAG: sulfatase-like hydrolase/transferase [Deltaproteobacteria bacterium]|nr:sulfatase-like hydrolase/transferase [Deltaproteobacteria bacterium]